MAPLLFPPGNPVNWPLNWDEEEEGENDDEEEENIDDSLEPSAKRVNFNDVNEAVLANGEREEVIKAYSSTKVCIMCFKVGLTLKTSRETLHRKNRKIQERRVQPLRRSSKK